MNQGGLRCLREALLVQAEGTTLEIGCGTGANLPFFPPTISSVTAIDPNPAMIPLARSQDHPKAVQIHWTLASVEDLPFLPESFDTLVSTLTLCSVPSLPKALAELLRVLKPGGQFLFLEHGQSPDVGVRRWQNGLTPIWKRLGDGCHLNRPMAQILGANSWNVTTLKSFYFPEVPRPFGFFYQGVAVKP